MRTQMTLEDIFVKIAINSDQKTVIICDRGVMDGSAYTDVTSWEGRGVCISPLDADSSPSTEDAVTTSSWLPPAGRAVLSLKTEEDMAMTAGTGAATDVTPCKELSASPR